MQLTRTMTLFLIAVALATPAFAGCVRATTDGQSIWLEGNGTPRLILTDPLGVILPSWLAGRIAYAREREDEAGVLHTEIVVIQDTGEVVRVIAVPDDTGVNGVLQLGWRDSARLFIEGHVNPATTLFLDWSPETGQLLDERAGSRFSVSSDGQSVAQRQHVPLGAPEEFSSAVMEVDGKVVYPAAGDDGRFHTFLTAPVWSQNDHHIAFLDKVAGETFLVALSLNSPTVKTDRVLLTLMGTDPRVSWSGGSHVIVRTSEEALRVQPGNGKIDPAAPGEGDLDDCSK